MKLDDLDVYGFYKNGNYLVEINYAPNGTKLFTFGDEKSELTPVKIVDRLASLQSQLAARDALIERTSKADGTVAEKWHSLVADYRAMKAKAAQ